MDYQCYDVAYYSMIAARMIDQTILSIQPARQTPAPVVYNTNNYNMNTDNTNRIQHNNNVYNNSCNNSNIERPQ